MVERDEDLEDLFAAARRQAPRPDAGLMGRIAADAARHAPGGAWRRVWTGIGGWPAIVGFATVAFAGVWIGHARPEAVETVIGTDGYEMADLMPGFGAEWEDAG